MESRRDSKWVSLSKIEHVKLTFLKDDIMSVAFCSNVMSNCVMSLHSKDVETIETIVLFKSYFFFN